VLQDFYAHDGVKRCIWLGNRGNVADDVQFAVIKRPCLQARGVALAVVLPKVLGNIVQMAAEFAIPLRPGTCVQYSAMIGYGAKCSFQPLFTGAFVVFAGRGPEVVCF